VRPTELGVEGPWLVYNRNSTVCQLLLLGVKADCLSLREGQQETGSSNSRAAEEWLHEGRWGGLSRAAEEWLHQDEGEASHLFWTTHDLDRQPPLVRKATRATRELQLQDSGYPDGQGPAHALRASYDRPEGLLMSCDPSG
jgi:hypothetical protein